MRENRKWLKGGERVVRKPTSEGESEEREGRINADEGGMSKVVGIREG